MKTKLIALLSLLFFFSCGENMPQPKEEFQEYLSSQFKLEFNQKIKYVLVPSLICKGCTDKLLLDLNSIDDNIKNEFLIIASHPSYDFSFLNNLEVLYDNDNFLDELSFSIVNVTLVGTKENGDWYKYSVRTDDLRSLHEILESISK
jgi:hypothetical protein